MWANWSSIGQGHRAQSSMPQKRTAATAFQSPGSSEGLIEQIKQMQRSDPSAKEQWIAYCDQFGEGRRDPSKHEDSFIQRFLAQFNQGVRFQGDAEAAGVGNVIKLMQRRSSAFKAAWAQYCAVHGGGKNDPTKHEVAFHIQFLDSLAQNAQSSASSMHPMAMMMGGGMDMHPMKRMRMMRMQMMEAADPEKDSLVAKIKSYQKGSAQQKENWWSYCDSQLGGVRDPARHDAETLMDFIRSYGVPEAASAAPSFSLIPMYPIRDSLVARIKEFQRSGEPQREAWYSFCGVKRDPARHESADLQQFVTQFGVP